MHSLVSFVSALFVALVTMTLIGLVATVWVRTHRILPTLANTLIALAVEFGLWELRSHYPMALFIGIALLFALLVIGGAIELWMTQRRDRMTVSREVV